jgi:glycosyltransferase involved in cell wall biosynthesis
MNRIQTKPRRLVVIPGDPISAYEAKGLDQLQRYYNPGGFFDQVFALSPFETVEQRLAHGMTIRKVPEPRFRETIRALRPDVVRAYGGHWPADVACRNRVAGVPIVASVHDTHPSMIHASLRYADRVWAVTPAVAEAAADRGVPTDHLRLFSNRIDLDVFYPPEGVLRLLCRGEKNIPTMELLGENERNHIRKTYPKSWPLWAPLAAQRSPEMPTRWILHVGRKSRQKNLETLLRALPFLPENYRVVFLGRGDADPYLRLARSLNVESRCVWIDSVPNRELPLWYAWCDLLCLPSRWEGFGIVFLEAAACGTPILTSRIPPMSDMFTDEKNALLISSYEDPLALMQSISRLIEEPDLAETLSRNAPHVARPFARPLVEAMEIDLYREVLSISRHRQSVGEWVWRFKSKNYMKLRRSLRPLKRWGKGKHEAVERDRKKAIAQHIYRGGGWFSGTNLYRMKYEPEP